MATRKYANWWKYGFTIPPLTLTGKDRYNAALENKEISLELAVEFSLIDVVTREFITRFRSRFFCWRLHKRCNPDNTGHGYSVLIIPGPDDSDNETHPLPGPDSEFTTFFNSHPLVERLIHVGGLVNSPVSGCAADISDANSDVIYGYTEPFYESWGPLITGVSESYLDLLEYVKTEFAPTAPALPLILDFSDPFFSFYRDIGNRVYTYLLSRPGRETLHLMSSVWGYILGI